MKYNVNSDIPLPPLVLKKQRKRITLWYEHHEKENKIPPYQFYHNGHLITLAFETNQTTQTKEITTVISLVLSSITLAATIGVLSYYLLVS